MNKASALVAMAGLGVLGLACAGEGGSSTGTGGATATGGSQASGGSPGAGGVTATGGAPAT
ncbi:MAG TPA: hypothetical protein VHM31_06525, partial [Polyangia bacterium]|nr:hypothetical protein [Polyangia bacterium]